YRRAPAAIRPAACRGSPARLPPRPAPASERRCSRAMGIFSIRNVSIATSSRRGTATMKLLPACCALALVCSVTAQAQDLLIKNARIIDGTGLRIDRGSIVVRNGRIQTVVEGDAD